MSFRYGPPTMTDGLVFYIDAANPKSYVSGDTTCTSLVGSPTQNILNGVTFNGANQGSWVFDDGDDYIEIGTIGQGPLYDIGTGDFTVNMWCAKDTTSTYGWFISNFDTPVSGFLMGVWNNTTSLYWRLYPGNFEYAGYEIPADLSFHNYTLTRNSGTVDVYVDAVLVSGGNSGYGGTLASTLVPTYVGKRSDGYADQAWVGDIALTQIYNKSLSAPEILQNYNTTKSRFI